MRLLAVIVIAVCLFWSESSDAARLFTCGFEENVTEATLTGGDDGIAMWFAMNAGATIQTTTPHSGTYALQIAGSTGKSIQRNLAANATSGTFYIRWYWMTNNPAVVSSRFFSVRSGGGLFNLSMTKTTGGAITLTNGVTSTATTSSATVSADTWYRFEIEYVALDAAGSITLRMYLGDAVSPIETLTITGEDTLNTNVQGFYWEESGANSGLTYRVDDIGINDATGTFQTSWPGPGKIYLLSPNAEVSTAFTPLSGTDNSLMVDDVPGAPDGDTTYNSHGTANGEDRLSLTSLGAEVPSNAVIRLADVSARVRGDTTAGSPQMRLLLWDDGGVQTNGPTSALNDSTTYAMTSTADHLVLDTGGKTKSNIDSFDVGYEPLTANNTFVTAVWVNVEWIEASGGCTGRISLLGVGSC